ncbi:hypothetical protein, partial [Bacillus sp. WP8]|uniref:hypothetical protein n=1 Tax=Bacillus sp. WP8 TaxID=756828 RepID=UPI001C92BC5F
NWCSNVGGVDCCVIRMDLRRNCCIGNNGMVKSIRRSSRERGKEGNVRDKVMGDEKKIWNQ